MTLTPDLVRLAILRSEGKVDQTYLGTEWCDPDEPARNFEERKRRCYELCTAAVLFGTAPEGTTIVHGSMDGHAGFGRLGHAWLNLPDGTVWEPITGDVFGSQEAWQVYADAEPEHEYTKREAAVLAVKHGHYGPWVPTRYR